MQATQSKEGQINMDAAKTKNNMSAVREETWKLNEGVRK